MNEEQKKLNNTIAEQNVIIDTLRITLLRAKRTIKEKKDVDYVFTRAAKWAMSADI